MKDINISIRKRVILGYVVDHFIQTGEPIGSSSLITKYGLDISASTIRKELNSLMKMDFLLQSHSSSGRFPTEKGLKYYVENILELDDRTNINISFLEKEYNSIDGTLDHVINETSHILSDYTDLTSLATLPSRNTLKIKSAELLNLRQNEYLLILIFEGGIAERNFIKLEKKIPLNQINSISNYLNNLIVGLTTEQIKEIVLSKINKVKNEYDEFLEKVFRISCELFERERKVKLLINGKISMLKFDDFIDSNKYATIIQILEEQEVLSKLLESVVKEESAKVFVGSQNGIPNGFSLIAAPYNKGNSYGSLGVLGTTRMNYSKIIPIVNYTAKMVSKMVNGGIGE